MMRTSKEKTRALRERVVAGRTCAGLEGMGTLLAGMLLNLTRENKWGWCGRKNVPAKTWKPEAHQVPEGHPE